MVEIIGVRFNRAGKIYYFFPGNEKFEQGDKVIVETVRGLEMGTAAFGNKLVDEKNIVQPLKSVVRKADSADIAKAEANKQKEKSAFETALEKINEHKLDMKLVDVEYTFDGSKILFYFTADGRVDFRDLVKSLASVFRARIELRQIGVRDESKHMGGLGICGRNLCCYGFLDEFHPVSIKMAKEQGLSLNPTKISGVCGRLMCCLQYEQEAYEEMIKITPRAGAVVETKDGAGVVIDSMVLKNTIRVKLHDSDETLIKTYHAKDVKIIKDIDDKFDYNEEEIVE